MKDYICLDLETTGTSPEINEIIEIGAIQLNQGAQKSTFQSLVRPRSQVPNYIIKLTGIPIAHLQKAPFFPQIEGSLGEFLGDNILIGHNLAFDLGFLAAAGLKLNNTTYDTLDLARLLLPSLPEYSLSALSTFLGIEHPPRHRAMDDAIATSQVFQKLKEKAESLKKEEMGEILRRLPLTGWGFERLFQDIYRSRAWVIEQEDTKKEMPWHQPPDKKKKEPDNTKRPPSSPLTDKMISSLFSPGSPLSKAFPSFENRPGQKQMAMAVNQAFLKKRHLLVEAGTGTGKSLAYLLPSLFLSKLEQKPIVISTNAINLQEQLLNKDIPDLRQIPSLKNLQIAQLKGRNNYLCMRRWRNLFYDGSLSPEEARLALRIYLWIKECKNGDRGEIQLKGEEEYTWKRICSLETDCLGGDCLYKQRGNCFFYKARDRAEEVNLLIINHALMISDMAAGNSILPDFNYLVIDEAHHLEDVATEHLGFRLKEKDMQDFLEDVKRTLFIYSKGEKPQTTSPQGPGQALKKEIKAQSDLILRDADRLKKEISLFYVKCVEFVPKDSSGPEEYVQKHRLLPRNRSLPGWKIVIKSCEEAIPFIEAVEKALEKLQLMVEALPKDLRGESFRYLPGLVQQCHEIEERLITFVLSPEEDAIYWLEVSRGEAALCSAPLNVAPALEKNLFSQKSSVVLTSATLCAGEDFSFIGERLGLKEAEQMRIPSPFNYSGSCLVIVAEDMPEPDKKNYIESLGEALKSLCLATKGKTMVLFTAYSSLRSLRSGLQPLLDREGITLLGQGLDGSPKQLLGQFRSQDNIILFGTSSFWEGVDVVGEALSVLAIVKLPFLVPSEPIFAARSEACSDPFKQYALPKAILRFKQGFGRLIRSYRDRGVLVVFDSRLKNKYYGKDFLEALPLCPVKFMPSRHIPREIKDWLGWS